MSSLLLRAQERAKVAESRYAMTRFLGTLVVLALLVQFAPQLTVSILVLKFFIFFAFFALTSYVHKAFKQRVSFWNALTQSWELTHARQRRDFETLKTHKPHWAAGPNLTKASCLPDLDPTGGLGLLLETCFSQKGSQVLQQSLNRNTYAPEEPGVVEKRQNLAKALTRFPSLLRRLELLRLQKEISALGHESFSSDQQGNITYQNNIKPILFYGLFSAAVWMGLLIFLFLRSFELSITYQAIFGYLFVAAIGTGFWGLFFRWFLLASQPLKDFWDVQEKVLKKISKTKKVPQSLQQNLPSLVNSWRIRTSQVLQNLIRARQNPLFWLLAHLLFPLDSLIAVALVTLRFRLGQGLQDLEERMADFDIAAAIARFQYENQEFQFVEPQFLAQNQRLQVQAMGHPLLPVTTRVCNDLSLTQDSPVVLLTGSNMAGKSTFLRALGLNAVLAHLGAPVCAQTFIFPRCRLLCAIKIEDSLEEHTSYFYAEVKRLKEIFQNLKAEKSHLPCVFFVDEIFKGTNNTERFIGSWYILKALFDTHAFGFVSTHDLVLTRLAQFDSRLVNMHFRERVEQDHLLFDYTLRLGPCTSSNALRIMRLEGLPIPENTEEAQAFLN